MSDALKICATVALLAVLVAVTVLDLATRLANRHWDCEGYDAMTLEMRP